MHPYLQGLTDFFPTQAKAQWSYHWHQFSRPQLRFGMPNEVMVRRERNLTSQKAAEPFGTTK